MNDLAPSIYSYGQYALDGSPVCCGRWPMARFGGSLTLCPRTAQALVRFGRKRCDLSSVHVSLTRLDNYSAKFPKQLLKYDDVGYLLVVNP